MKILEATLMKTQQNSVDKQRLGSCRSIFLVEKMTSREGSWKRHSTLETGKHVNRMTDGCTCTDTTTWVRFISLGDRCK